MYEQYFALKERLLMAIIYDENTRTFRLDAGQVSYAFRVDEQDNLIHLYFGAHISDTDLSYLSFSIPAASFSPSPQGYAESGYSLDTQRQELPCRGAGDFRTEALAIRGVSGCSATSLKYSSYRILPGKYALPGMPAVYAGEDEAQTLDITLFDALTRAEVHLLYGVLNKYDAIMRACVVKNTGAEPFVIEKVSSAAIDFPRMDFDLLHLYGNWAQERMIERKALTRDICTVSSLRGSSSHLHNPFAALLGRNTTEEHGDAYGFSLVYSGNFAIETECSYYDCARVVMGINPVDFAWRLEPGETFTTPEAVLVYSPDGLGGMSRVFSRLYRNQLCRGEWKTKRRPILINNWEATYFDFDEKKLLAIAEAAAELGIEMLVMDDGWFGCRNDDRSSLGDWFVNEEKLPGGLSSLAEKVNKLGLKFGIWIEPEMVSHDSELYRAHPDWCLCAPGREKSIARHQYVLDLSRGDVRDYLFEVISGVLSSAEISYVKWDFNRNLSEVGSALLPPERQQEVFHRYVLGLYSLFERLIGAFPHILFEGCSGGGGRFDPGMLYYAPQIWTSDDTDAIERCKIQYGTSVVYPLSSVSAHVSASPNHQTKRSTSFETRGNVALAGAFGYELDITKLTEEERTLVRRQTAQYKEYAQVVQSGDFYRLISPFEDENRCAWESVSEDKSRVIVTYIVTRCKIHMTTNLRLRGLDANKRYRDTESGRVYSGDTLMNAGLNLDGQTEDGYSKIIFLTAE